MLSLLAVSKPLAAACLSAAAFVAFRNPNQTDPAAEKRVAESVQHLVRPFQTGAPAAAALLLYLFAYARGLETEGPQLAEWTVAEAAGVAVCLAGAAGRLWCYRTLGRLFTFDLAIRPRHALVTSGPYRYARHPSYTALVAALAGYFGFLFPPAMAGPYCAALGIDALPPPLAQYATGAVTLGARAPTLFMALFILFRIPKVREAE